MCRASASCKVAVRYGIWLARVLPPALWTWGNSSFGAWRQGEAEQPQGTFLSQEKGQGEKGLDEGNTLFSLSS